MTDSAIHPSLRSSWATRVREWFAPPRTRLETVTELTRLLNHAALQLVANLAQPADSEAAPARVESIWERMRAERLRAPADELLRTQTLLLDLDHAGQSLVRAAWHAHAVGDPRTRAAAREIARRIASQAWALLSSVKGLAQGQRDRFEHACLSVEDSGHAARARCTIALAEHSGPPLCAEGREAVIHLVNATVTCSRAVRELRGLAAPRSPRTEPPKALRA